MDLILNHQQVDPLDGKSGVGCIGGQKRVSNGLKILYTEKVTPSSPMLIMELFMKTWIVLQQQGCFLHHPCFEENQASWETKS